MANAVTSLITGILKLPKILFVDSFVNIVGDLFEQPLLMWFYIGWGWLCVVVMAASMFQTAMQIAAG